MAKINEEERDLIRQLRERLADLDLTDEDSEEKHLIRFIRARSGKLNEAEEMFRKNVQWKEEQEISTILEWKEPYADFGDHFPLDIVGFDNLGGPVWMAKIGEWDPSKVPGQKYEFMRVTLQKMETMFALMKSKSKGQDQITQFTAICDLKNLGWRSYTTYDAFHGVLKLLRYFEANYPETLRTCFLLNAPSLFGFFWKLIEPIMSGATYGKLQFLKSDEESWRETLLNYIPEDQFPARYGGTLPDNFRIPYPEIRRNLLFHENGNNKE